MKEGCTLLGKGLVKRGGIHIQTHRLTGGIYKYAAEMGSDAITHVQSFTKIGAGIKKFMGGGAVIHRHTDSVRITQA
jgi:hypothetical protein